MHSSWLKDAAASGLDNFLGLVLFLHSLSSLSYSFLFLSLYLRGSWLFPEKEAKVPMALTKYYSSLSVSVSISWQRYKTRRRRRKSSIFFSPRKNPQENRQNNALEWIPRSLVSGLAWPCQKTVLLTIDRFETCESCLVAYVVWSKL